jgi:hypothetical protein
MMLTTQLHKWLIATDRASSRTQIIFWLSLSLTFSVIFAWLGLQEAFDGQYVVQDDARQHVFWMQRFLDPQLFPNDLITNYFQAVAPDGYTAVYRVMASLGIQPLVLNKLLPMVLGLITTAYCFGLALEILPVPILGFTASLLLNQNLWMKDDLISATPRGFLYPIFLAFLYYLLRRDAGRLLWNSLIPCLISISLIGLFYPQYIFVAVGILLLRLLRWQNNRIQFSNDRRDYLFCGLGIGVAILVLLPFALGTSEYGPAIAASEAKKLPEFLRRGRSSFFVDDPLDYWLFGRRSGMMPRSLFTPVTLCLGPLLPVLLRYPRRFPLVERINHNLAILPQILLAAVGMFLAAHALLFRLHLPSRYTGHSFRIVMALAAAIVLVVLLDSVLGWATAAIHQRKRQWVALGVTTLLAVSLVFYPYFVARFPVTAYQKGLYPDLYQFFARQPKETLVASLADEAGNLPTFSQRSVLVAREYAIPYHVGYYNQFRQRVAALIQAQYTPKLTILQQFIRDYGVDFWLLDPTAFSYPELAKNRWLRQYQPAMTEALTALAAGQTPALVKTIEPCRAFQSQVFTVVSTQCILQMPKP